MFDQQDLIGLQFELECLSLDQQADYNQFFEIFFCEGNSDHAEELKLSLPKKDSYSLTDYEELLGRISAHVKKDDLPIENVFKIYWKQSGFISYDHLRRIFEILEFPLSDKEFDILVLYADETNQQTVHGHDLLQQILNAEQLAPTFNIFQWKLAATMLDGKVGLLE